MKTAKLDLCEKLFAVSQWDDTSLRRHYASEKTVTAPDFSKRRARAATDKGTPLYDIYFLLSKTPKTLDGWSFVLIWDQQTKQYGAGWWLPEEKFVNAPSGWDKEPVNAVAKLLLALHEARRLAT